MGDISIEDTFEHNGRTYGIRYDKRGHLDIWVYSPGNNGSHRAWQRVHKFEGSVERPHLEKAKEWVQNHIYD